MDTQTHAVVEEATTQLKKALELQPVADRVTITVTHLPDPHKPASNDNQERVYQVSFRVRNGNAFFEDILIQ